MVDKTEIQKLVEAFRKNLQQIKETSTPEAIIRQEYVDHFWELLGRDIHNKQHKISAQKDVLIEASIITVDTLKKTRLHF